MRLGMSPARYQDNRISWQDTLCDECMRLCMSLGLVMSPARYQDNRISWQDTLCDECMRFGMSLGLVTVKREMLVAIIFGGFENITIC